MRIFIPEDEFFQQALQATALQKHTCNSTRQSGWCCGCR